MRKNLSKRRSSWMVAFFARPPEVASARTPIVPTHLVFDPRNPRSRVVARELGPGEQADQGRVAALFAEVLGQAPEKFVQEFADVRFRGRYELRLEE